MLTNFPVKFWSTYVQKWAKWFETSYITPNHYLLVVDAAGALWDYRLV